MTDLEAEREAYYARNGITPEEPPRRCAWCGRLLPESHLGAWKRKFCNARCRNLERKERLKGT